jgi:hypothetical protein
MAPPSRLNKSRLEPGIHQLISSWEVMLERGMLGGSAAPFCAGTELDPHNADLRFRRYLDKLLRSGGQRQ